MQATTYEVHPAADLFPMMPDEEIRQLADDIKANGQRLPVVLWQGRIVDGRNRVRACELVGIEPRTERREFADDADVARFVVSANIKRRHLNESQRAMLGARLEEIYAGPARERQAASQLRGRDTFGNPARSSARANLPEPTRARDDAARDVSVSPRSVQAAKAVIQRGAPELVRAVDLGKVAVSTAAVIAEAPKAAQAEIVARGEREIIEASKRIRAERAEKRRAERVEKILEISNGNRELTPDTVGSALYPVLYADPPWRYEHIETESRAIENQYPTMDLDAICGLPVQSITTPDAILFLWATSPKLAEAMRVVESWGFTYRTCMVWDKEVLGMGYYARQQHELLLICTKGSIPTPPPAARPASVIRVKRGEHSAKPEAFREIIESMYPDLPRVELFCRTPRSGWAVWGNQV